MSRASNASTVSGSVGSHHPLTNRLRRGLELTPDGLRASPSPLQTDHLRQKLR
ncbi:MAG: hypothetical protein OXO56_14220 [Gammaproteobacteria bacterium]|nr:hypothetical protein [Gammaproteobacteria bacterium]